jgi:DNA-binding NarL/FixJ family response regulator
VGKDIKLTALDTLLQHLINLGPSERKPNSDKKLFSLKERRILCDLLQGKKLVTIAQEMDISYRAACRHKKNGLKRAGVTSLRDILQGYQTNIAASKMTSI